MWRLIPIMVAFLISGADPQLTDSQPATTQSAADAATDFDERLWAVERDLAAIRHLITTGEVKVPVVPRPPAPHESDDDVDRRLDELESRESDLHDLDRRVDDLQAEDAEARALERRVRELERLVGGPDRNLVTQSPTGIRTQVEALERRVDQLERSFRELQRELDRQARQIDRLGRP